jgi:hypothetical protein
MLIFNVYDLARSSGRSTEMDKAELIDFARGYRAAALDYVVVLSVDALIEPKINRTNIETFINGQVIQLGSGRVSGAFSIDGRQVNATKNCRRSSVSDGLRRSLVSLDGELSAEILSALAKPVKVKGKVARSEQISSEGPSASQYTLIFDGFSQDDMLDIEHYLEIFSGYKSLHYRTSERRYSELDYRAQISRAKLTRNLNRVLSELSMDGAVKVTGDTVKITKLQQKSSTKFDTEGWE